MATKTPGSASAQTEALGQLAAFPLVEALFGRRSRRFALGGEIPDGPLAYRSSHQPLPLDELERLLVLTAMGGTTGWDYSITRHARYAPHVSNYAAAAGRTFPSAAGFHTAELFFTDDTGVWFFPTRDAGALVDPAVEEVTPELMVQRHRGRLRQLAEGRLYLPAAEPYLEGHNTWCVNVPGSLLVIPVADIAQHLLAILCFFAQNGYGIYDDVNRRPIPGLEQFRGLVDVEEPVPLTFAEQYALTEATAELACACYAGVLVLQAMGLGGPFHPDTPGAWTDSPRIRGSAQVHDQAFQACVALQAQYVLDTFGKFPGTVPTLFILNYLQAHHLDLEFYDQFFKSGAYLPTHAEHLARWHGGPEEG
jgi:hypothetical protein